MDKPTEEQVKEFWEWCGLKYHGIGSELLIYAPDGIVFNCGQPSIDLNNLFKYAVPKISEFTEILISIPPQKESRFIVQIGHYQERFEHKDPALALFWAIWEVIDS